MDLQLPDPYPAASIVAAQITRDTLSVDAVAWRQLWNFKEQQRVEIERLRVELRLALQFCAAVYHDFPEIREFVDRNAVTVKADDNGT